LLEKSQKHIQISAAVFDNIISSSCPGLCVLCFKVDIFRKNQQEKKIMNMRSGDLRRRRLGGIHKTILSMKDRWFT
jgi:hypothetical protein